MDDLAPVIEEFAEDVTVTRRSEGTITDGRAGPATSSTFAARIALMPATMRDLMQLPEGMRDQGTMKGFSTREVQDRPPDRFTYGGAAWQVMKIDDWSAHGNYWRFFATRMTR